MPKRRARVADPAPADDAERTADRLHSAAIHLLRRLRREDAKSGLSAPRLSALSVVVFGGPITLGDLAAAEQVKPPTMTRLVRALDAEGLVRREADPQDGRIVRLRATARGENLLYAGRARRVHKLSEPLASLTAEEQRTLQNAAEILSRVISRLS